MWSRSLVVRLIKTSTQKGTGSEAVFQRSRSAPKIAKKIFNYSRTSIRHYARNLEPKDQKVFELLAKQEAVSLERQAELAWTNRDWARATQLWREASDCWERAMPKLTALHRLASLLCSRGLYAQCEGVYKEALQLIDALPAQIEQGLFDDAPTAPSYDVKLIAELRTVLQHELGRLYVILGRAAEAHELLLDAAREWQGWTLLDPSKRGLTAAMSADVALFYEHRSNYREAKQWHLLTLQRNNGQDPLPWEHPQHSSTLHSTLQRFNKPTRAERQHVFDTLEEVQHSIHEHIAHCGPEHVTLVPLYLSEAVAARQLDLNRQALEALTRAAEISLKRHGEGHVAHATVLHHMGLHYNAVQHEEEAVKHSLTALQIKQAALGHEHFHVALIQWDLGMYKLRANKYAECHFLLHNACEVLGKQYATRDHPVLQHMRHLTEEVQRAMPASRPAVNSMLLNALKDNLQQHNNNTASDSTASSDAARDFAQALFNRDSTAPPSAQGEAVQQLLNKYLGDRK